VLIFFFSKRFFDTGSWFIAHGSWPDLVEVAVAGEVVVAVAV